MSLEGGLEEFEEFFLAWASSASKEAIRFNSGAVALATASATIFSTSRRVKTLTMPLHNQNAPILQYKFYTP
jgi:hypothetical protein